MNGTRAVAAGVLLAAGLAWSARAWAPTGYGWSLGSGGWSLEQFGRDITILRSRAASAPALAPARDANLFLSCSPGNLRLRITLPEPLPGRAPTDGPGGFALVRARAPDAGSARGRLGRFATPGPNQIEFRDRRGEEGVVSDVVALLRERAAEIEVLMGFGTAPPTIGAQGGRGLVAYGFRPVFGAGDAALLTHVGVACRPGPEAPPE